MEETGMTRKWNVWLSLLVTVGVAVASDRAKADESDVPYADPQVPLPIGHDRMSKGGFYTAGEFLYFQQTNPLKSQVLAVRGILDFDGSISADLNGQTVFPAGGPPVIIPGPAAPGTFYGSGTGALNADQAKGPTTWQPGFRLTAGWKFSDGSAVDFSWMRLMEAKYSGSASLVPESLSPGVLLQETFLFAPVYNYPSEFGGAPNKIALGNPFAAFGIWNGANEMSVTFVQRTSIYDINYRIPVYNGEYCRSYGTCGGRYVQMWEAFTWRTVDAEFDGTSSQNDVAVYNNITANDLWGAYVGAGTEFYIGKGFAISLDAKAAGLMDFAKEIAKYTRGDMAIGFKRSQRDYSFVPELQGTVNCWWYPFEGCQVRVGYDAMNFWNTFASEQPVDFNYGSSNPGWQRTYRYLGGFQAGIGFIF
jgi:hypothetical protein